MKLRSMFLMCSLILLLLVPFGLFPTFSQAQNNPGGISGPGWFVGEGSPVSPDQAEAYFAAKRAELAFTQPANG